MASPVVRKFSPEPGESPPAKRQCTLTNSASQVALKALESPHTPVKFTLESLEASPSPSTPARALFRLGDTSVEGSPDKLKFECLPFTPPRRKSADAPAQIQESIDYSFNALLPDRSAFGKSPKKVDNKELEELLASRQEAELKETHLQFQESSKISWAETATEHVGLTELNPIGDKLFDFKLNGTKCRGRELSQGDFHRVFELIGDGTLKVNGQELPLNTLVVRLAYLEADCKLHEAELNERFGYYKKDFQGMQLIDRITIDNRPLAPLTYAWPKPPSGMKDLLNYSNGVWIKQKLSKTVSTDGWSHDETLEEISKENLELLEFVRKVITAFALQKRWLPDFFPRNVMKNVMMHEGRYYVVDAEYADEMFSDKELAMGAFESELGKQLSRWSGYKPGKNEYNGNVHVFDFLCHYLPNKLYKELFKYRPQA